MDPLGAFKSEVFRPIASIVLPGMLAISMPTLVLANAVPEVRHFYDTQAIAFLLLFLAASTIFGMLLENIGTSIERGIDQCMEVEYLPGSEKVWGLYLALPCSDTYARKYLGTLVTRLKFINAMIPAMVFFGVGLVALKMQLGRWHGVVFLLAILWIIALIVWLFRTSTELSEAALFSRWKMIPEGLVHIDVNVETPSRFRHLAYVLIELRSSRAYDYNMRSLGRWELLREILTQMVVAMPNDRIRKNPKVSEQSTGDGMTVRDRELA